MSSFLIYVCEFLYLVLQNALFTDIVFIWHLALETMGNGIRLGDSNSHVGSISMLGGSIHSLNRNFLPYTMNIIRSRGSLKQNKEVDNSPDKTKCTHSSHLITLYKSFNCQSRVFIPKLKTKLYWIKIILIFFQRFLDLYQ